MTKPGILNLVGLAQRLRRRGQGSTGPGARINVNPRLKQLMKELGEAINDSLSESEQIAEVIAKIKAGGYDVFLVLEATIGFNKHEDGNEKIPAVRGRSDAEFRINAQDLKFLKALRISVDDGD